MCNSYSQTGITVGSYHFMFHFDFLYREDQNMLFWFGVAEQGHQQ